MKKRTLVIGLVVVVAVVLTAVLWLSCAGEQGSIRIEATLDGAPWTGAVQYTLTGTDETIQGTSVARTLTVAPGTWTCAYVSGGPDGASLVDITPSPSQTVSEGGTITFTMNFAAEALETTVEVQATLCGEPWQGAVSYTLSRTDEPVAGTSVGEAFTVRPGTWTCEYVSGGPGRAYLADITPSPTQALAGGGTVTFTLDFELAQDARVEFAYWTINGERVEPNAPKTAYTVAWGDIIGALFKQHVAGCEGQMAMAADQSELSIHYEKGTGSVQILVLNQPGAVVMEPAAERSSLVLGVDGTPVFPDTYHDLVLCTPGLLDLDTVWELAQGTQYTNKINWLRIGEDPQPVNGPYVLYELGFDGPGPFGFALVSYSTIGLVYGQDANPDNNHAESPPLYITVLGGP
ncbi:MAG: hypothetical protein IBX67_08250 [Dehalococcoidia bacterium]|nr:hypothetical protein [Dehalococcoidia bacterium]